MNYSTSLCLTLFSFFLGISAGCFFAILAGKLFRQFYLRCRFSLACVFLAFAISTFSIMLIFLPESHSLTFFTRNDVFFWLIIFFAGLLISSFWKYLLIPAFLIFLAVWIHSYLFLQKFFSTPQNKMFVSSQKTSVIVDEKLFHTPEFSDRNILLKVYSLPKRLILPLPRFWTKYTVVLNQKDAEDEDFSKYFENEDYKLVNKKNMFEELIQQFDYWLVKNEDYITVPIPDSRNYPVLYTLSIKPRFDKVDVQLKRNL